MKKKLISSFNKKFLIGGITLLVGSSNLFGASPGNLILHDKMDLMDNLYNNNKTYQYRSSSNYYFIGGKIIKNLPTDNHMTGYDVITDKKYKQDETGNFIMKLSDIASNSNSYATFNPDYDELSSSNVFDNFSIRLTGNWGYEQSMYKLISFQLLNHSGYDVEVELYMDHFLGLSKNNKPEKRITNFEQIVFRFSDFFGTTNVIQNLTEQLVISFRKDKHNRQRLQKMHLQNLIIQPVEANLAINGNSEILPTINLGKIQTGEIVEKKFKIKYIGANKEIFLTRIYQALNSSWRNYIDVSCDNTYDRNINKTIKSPKKLNYGEEMECTANIHASSSFEDGLIKSEVRLVGAYKEDKATENYDGKILRYFNIAYTKVSDIPPVMQNFLVTLNKNDNYDFTVKNFSDNFLDENDEDYKNPVKIIIKKPLNGVLLFDNVEITADSTEFIKDDLSKLTYKPNKDFIGEDSFEWNGIDKTNFTASENGKVIIRVRPIKDVKYNYQIVESKKTYLEADNYCKATYNNNPSLAYDIDDDTLGLVIANDNEVWVGNCKSYAGSDITEINTDCGKAQNFICQWEDQRIPIVLYKKTINNYFSASHLYNYPTDTLTEAIDKIKISNFSGSDKLEVSSADNSSWSEISKDEFYDLSRKFRIPADATISDTNKVALTISSKTSSGDVSDEEIIDIFVADEPDTSIIYGEDSNFKFGQDWKDSLKYCKDVGFKFIGCGVFNRIDTFTDSDNNGKTDFGKYLF